MHKIIIALLSFALLTSCGNSDGEPTSSNQGTVLIENSAYSISVPSNWSKVPPATIKQPASGTFEMAYRSNDPSGSFYNNIIIMSEPVREGVTSFSFVDSIVVRDSSHYDSFVPKEKKLVTLSDDQETVLHVFNARYNELTQQYLFLQSGAVCTGTGYIITIGLSSSTDQENIEKYESLMRSFACQNNDN